MCVFIGSIEILLDFITQSGPKSPDPFHVLLKAIGEVEGKGSGFWPRTDCLGRYSALGQNVLGDVWRGVHPIYYSWHTHPIGSGHYYGMIITTFAAA